MARPLRVQHPGGWTHVMSRGINKKPIFTEDRDRERFLELLETAVARFRIRLHACVLMDNHFHMLVETPEGNLSATLQWIKQTYSMWHNIKHDRVGPLFQGRFRSVPVEDAAWAYELSLYIHLNPLRLARFKLSRVERQGEGALPDSLPSREEATKLLGELRRYAWSSYRAYGGYTRTPAWLTTEVLLERAGGEDQRRTYRETVQERLTVGVEMGLAERLKDVAAVGTAAFVEGVRKRIRKGGREIAGRHEASGRVALETLIGAVERVTGVPVSRTKRGGLGRNLALKLARDEGGWKLRELGEQMGGLDYVTVHMSIRRLEEKMAHDIRLSRLFLKLKAEM